MKKLLIPLAAIIAMCGCRSTRTATVYETSSDSSATSGTLINTDRIDSVIRSISMKIDSPVIVASYDTTDNHIGTITISARNISMTASSESSGHEQHSAIHTGSDIKTVKTYSQKDESISTRSCTWKMPLVIIILIIIILSTKILIRKIGS